jgi:hypothetical protein
VITTPAIDQLERLYDLRFTPDETHLLAPAGQLDAYDVHRRRVLLGALQTCLCPVCGTIICQRSAAGMPLLTCPATVRADDDYTCPDCEAALVWHLTPLSGAQWFTAVSSNAAALADAERRFPRLEDPTTLDDLRARLGSPVRYPAVTELEDPYEPRHPDAYPYGAPWGPDNPAPDSAWGRAQAARVTARQAAVWAAWHALADDDPHPIATVATVTGLPPAQVRAVIGGDEETGPGAAFDQAGELPADVAELLAAWAAWAAENKRVVVAFRAAAPITRQAAVWPVSAEEVRPDTGAGYWTALADAEPGALVPVDTGPAPGHLEPPVSAALASYLRGDPEPADPDEDLREAAWDEVARAEYERDHPGDGAR